MKRITALLLILAIMATLFVGCTDNGGNPTDGSNPSGSNPTDSAPTTPSTPVDPWAEYKCITIAEALTLCEEFVDAPSETWYYIRATIDSVDNDTYGQLTISDGTGTIMVYGSYNKDGSVRYDAMTEKPVAGDEVLLYGRLQNYKGNTKEVQKANIIDFIHKESSGSDPELPADGTKLTVAELLALPLKDGQVTTQKYLVEATVESITNAERGSMWIGDDTGSISIFYTKNADGSVGYADMDDKPYKGDTVILSCIIKNYKGTIEINEAYIVEFKHNEVSINPEDYTEMSIADARNTETGTKVKVSGVVAQITYANGRIPSGVILVDGTSSIYVYDGDLAARCAIGNTISIYASKTYWILEDEKNSADKFGYKGCNQLENVVLISNDEGNTAFDTSWIQETTVKEILDTPASTDITTIIYKVTAQVKKVPGNGFVNYYINDLDGATGTYAYTQCNGSDFAWLDAFDGKVCTVYVMALNAKSTSSDCFWRFLPIAVKEEGFDPSTVNIAEHVVKYYGVGQFLDTYTGNPALELLTSVNGELLGYTDAKLSYSSSDNSIISIDDNIMNCHKSGTATITVTGSYGGKTYAQDVTITVKISEQGESYPTVNEVINANVNETVTVQGIVGPSLVNRSGFYLIDETGVIAIVTDAETLASLQIGNKVVIRGLRDKFHNGQGDHSGQAAITSAVVVSNAYGNHAYSTASFDGNISVADFYNLDIKVDYTTSVFTMKATVLVEESQYSNNIYLTDGTTKVRLYCSSASQYNWLKAYAGQEVTVEIAPCNWNNKTYYVGCVLAVVHADGTKTLNTLNFK